LDGVFVCVPSIVPEIESDPIDSTDSTDPTDLPDSDPTTTADPIDPTDPTDPIDPTESTDPTEPPSDPVDSVDPFDSVDPNSITATDTTNTDATTDTSTTDTDTDSIEYGGSLAHSSATRRPTLNSQTVVYLFPHQNKTVDMGGGVLLSFESSAGNTVTVTSQLNDQQCIDTSSVTPYSFWPLLFVNITVVQPQQSYTATVQVQWPPKDADLLPYALPSGLAGLHFGCYDPVCDCFDHTPIVVQNNNLITIQRSTVGQCALFDTEVAAICPPGSPSVSGQQGLAVPSSLAVIVAPVVALLLQLL
jgi:hypothetical protein